MGRGDPLGHGVIVVYLQDIHWVDRLEGEKMGLFSKDGTLEIHLDHPSVNTGETLTGHVTIDVEKPLTGCTLNIELIGKSRRKTTGFRRDSEDNHWERFFKEELTIIEDATVEASPATHAFEMFIPAELGVVEVDLPSGTLGGIAETFLENLASRQEFRWRLYARLVIPGLFNDLKADTEVQIKLPEDRVR